jgi:hypothetical protein
MNAINRRHFLAAAARTISATRLRAQSAAKVTLTIPAEADGPHMPEDYVGLSYEVQQLVDLPFPKPLRASAERNNRDIPARQLSNMAMVAAATRGRLRAWCGIETWVRRIDRIGHRLCLPPPWKKP